ncbi:hypothetical protein [Desulfosporosinus lacus]|uniref:Uncharacterized protein n=1 Tax=Desulfosporosinus lacus DSM 15449 TaxID=1121420 RepID=A0A1M5Y160_9FIRM|nr:hypothetical protein [Desulfosporosinus lacus]SHI05732.1 hypothetical protein SAMN02746098_02184 [Desulfosporosinus lacus DSM 15449]
MPLTILSPGKEAVVEACRAKEITKKFLEGLTPRKAEAQNIIVE